MHSRGAKALRTRVENPRARIAKHRRVGDRTDVAAGGTGSGPTFSGPYSLTNDPAGDRLVVATGADVQVIDLATGERAVFAR